MHPPWAHTQAAALPWRRLSVPQFPRRCGCCWPCCDPLGEVPRAVHGAWVARAAPAPPEAPKHIPDVIRRITVSLCKRCAIGASPTGLH